MFEDQPSEHGHDEFGEIHQRCVSVVGSGKRSYEIISVCYIIAYFWGRFFVTHTSKIIIESLNCEFFLIRVLRHHS